MYICVYDFHETKTTRMDKKKKERKREKEQQKEKDGRIGHRGWVRSFARGVGLPRGFGRIWKFVGWRARLARDWFCIRHGLDRFEKLDWLSGWFALSALPGESPSRNGPSPSPLPNLLFLYRERLYMPGRLYRRGARIYTHVDVTYMLREYPEVSARERRRRVPTLSYLWRETSKGIGLERAICAIFEDVFMSVPGPLLPLSYRIFRREQVTACKMETWRLTRDRLSEIGMDFVLKSREIISSVHHVII